MSSREIADLVEARHDSVKRTIERLAEKRVIQLPPTVNTEIINGLGKKQQSTMYQVCKRDSYVVVAQLCPIFTARLVDRWQLLEAQVLSPSVDPMTALNDPATMRGLLLGYTEKVLTLENQVQKMKPDVDALHRIAKSDGGTCISNAAKDLQIRPKDLFTYLSANSWIYRRAGGKSWLAYQSKIQAGLLEHKVTVITHGDGTEKTVEQVLVTPKGLTKLSQLIAELVV
ncbi:DNA-binding protein [Serratia oryzae]|uniref:DNA-binding protein n=2 Tax=Serratia oryzae TaxID=2034155 RepID=A0A1S8CQK0_9GAMM|nr:phage antirepressor KilAC domain-containing protein [Serratia oryzae]OMQ27342.1 DNA-binding protein [Serratia oryzae]